MVYGGPAGAFYLDVLADGQHVVFPTGVHVDMQGGIFDIAGTDSAVNISSGVEIAIESGGSISVQSGGFIDVLTGGIIKANGTQAAAITAASEAHALNAVFSDTEAESALNTLGAKINAIITALEGVGVLIAN